MVEGEQVVFFGFPLTDDELLGGLWWSDEEFGPAVSALWNEYVERMHQWEKYKLEVATALRHLLRVTKDPPVAR